MNKQAKKAEEIIRNLGGQFRVEHGHRDREGNIIPGTCAYRHYVFSGGANMLICVFPHKGFEIFLPLDEHNWEDITSALDSYAQESRRALHRALRRKEDKS